MLLVILILPGFSSENYSTFRHTTSQLGAQGSPNAWIMNLTFILIGSATLLYVRKPLKGLYFHLIMATGFSLSLVLTGVFSLRPIDESIPFNKLHDTLHSVFASSTGVSFTMLAMASGLTQKTGKTPAFLIAILATLLSVLIFYIPEYAGIWQRLMFGCCFLWILLNFDKNRYESE